MELEQIFSWPPTPAKWRALKSLFLAYRVIGGRGIYCSRSSSGTLISTRKTIPGKGGSSNGPFQVSLFPKKVGETVTYEVTVAPGYVCEIVPGPGQAIELHEPDNIWDDTDPTQPAKFAIAAGEAIYVKVPVTAEGSIGGDSPVTLAIADDEEESTHYQPQVDDETASGAAGSIYYKLALLEAGEGPEDPPKLKRFLSGSHISYFQELPALKTTLHTDGEDDGIGVIPKEWSDAEKAYKLRALSKGLGKLTIKTNGDSVDIRGNKKDHAVYIDVGDNEATSPELEFEDGLSATGVKIEGDEPEKPELAPTRIKIPVVRAAPGTEEHPAQIQVKDVGLVAPVYEVEGNGKNGARSYKIGDQSKITFLEWTDGLVTSEDDETIEIPAASAPEGDTFLVQEQGFTMETLGNFEPVGSPTDKYWVLDGIWYTSEPDGFPASPSHVMKIYVPLMPPSPP